MSTVLKAPFPWFGGKSRVAHLVWDRFGNPANYVEPFAGSLAVLLARPHPPRNETVNDKDALLSNFWRAVEYYPEDVARFADWPVSEADLHARHLWIVKQYNEGFRERMLTDPEFCDPKIAGWWVWGLSQWIGSGWCQKPEWTGRGSAARAPRGLNRVRPHLQRGGQGVTQDFSPSRQLQRLFTGGRGVTQDFTTERKRPLLGRGAHGVHAKMPRMDRLEGINGRYTGVGAPVLPQQLPDISGDGASGRGVNAVYVSDLYEYMDALSSRLRRVRVCCGEWDRILGPSPTTKIGLTGVFLDPPYGVSDRDVCYNEDSREVSHLVRAWAIEHGSDPLLRIALCGYDDEHSMPDDWEVVHWKANGGYGNQGQETAGQRNSRRERIWFSPHCLRPGLFSLLPHNSQEDT